MSNLGLYPSFCWWASEKSPRRCSGGIVKVYLWKANEFGIFLPCPGPDSLYGIFLDILSADFDDLSTLIYMMCSEKVCRGCNFHIEKDAWFLHLNSKWIHSKHAVVLNVHGWVFLSEFVNHLNSLDTLPVFSLEWFMHIIRSTIRTITC